MAEIDQGLELDVRPRAATPRRGATARHDVLVLGQTYAYRAIDGDGLTVRGEISAPDQVTLQHRLMAMGLDLVSARPISDRRARRLRPLSPSDLAQMFLHLELLTSSGAPLIDSLSDIREAADHPQLRDLIADLINHVAAGNSFSAALARHPRRFDPVMVAIIRAGEVTGTAAHAFRDAAEYVDWLAQLRRAAWRAFVYPALVTLIALVAIGVLMLVVAPQVIVLLNDSGQPLPAASRALLAVADGISAAWWVLPLLAGAAVLAYRGAVRLTERARQWLDHLTLSLPLFGRVRRQLALGRHAGMLGLLLRHGTDLRQALDLAAEQVTSPILRARLTTLRSRVDTGSSLASAWAKSGLYPGLVVRLIGTGEAADQLPRALDRVAKFYRGSVDSRIDTAIRLIEPVMILIVAGALGWVALGVLWPLYAALDQLGGI